MTRKDPLRRAPSERECFADEIAVDFLSVASVVERMRAAFFTDEEVIPPLPPRAVGPASRSTGRSTP